MKRYEKYKPSRIKWIEEVPEHWDEVQLKRTVIINPSKSASPYDSNSDELVTFLPMERVCEDGTFDTSLKKSVSELWNGFTYFEEGDVIVAKITPCFENGKGALLSNLGSPVGFGSTEFHVLRAKDRILKEYLYHVTRTKLFNNMGKAFMYGAAGQQRVPTSFLEEFITTLPTKEEQCAISRYLDRKIAEIDELIAKKQRLIVLLNEEKTAIINYTVTKGLNPDALMKDSGISWVGTIPRHWAIVPLTKYLESIVDYRGKTPTKSDSGVFLVTARNIKDGIINYSLSEEYIVETEYESTMRRGELAIGDVLFTTEAPLGEAANVDRIDVAVAQRIIKFRGKTGVLNNYYLKHWLMTPIFRQDLYSYATGSTAIGIKASKLTNLKLILPPIREQEQIVTFLSDKEDTNNGTILRVKTEIELLQEYRTALISEVVTGKIDVREAN